MVIEACDELGQSVAGFARQHDLNANLLHKWRKQFKACGADDFIRLTAAVQKSGSISLRQPILDQFR
jgi:transposase-like protein